MWRKKVVALLDQTLTLLAYTWLIFLAKLPISQNHCDSIKVHVPIIQNL